MAHKILIVEDSHFYRQLLKELLESRFPGLTIEEAADENEAIRKIDSVPPDVILIDVKLPGNGGLQLTKEIKEKHPDTKIAVLTAYDTPEYREAASSHGADKFLSKGSDSNKTILEFVRSALNLPSKS